MTRVPKSVCKWMHRMYIRHNSAYNFHRLCRMYSDDKCICNPKWGCEPLLYQQTCIGREKTSQVETFRAKILTLRGNFSTLRGNLSGRTFIARNKKADTSHIFFQQYKRSAMSFLAFRRFEKIYGLQEASPLGAEFWGKILQKNTWLPLTNGSGP